MEYYHPGVGTEDIWSSLVGLEWLRAKNLSTRKVQEATYVFPSVLAICSQDRL